MPRNALLAATTLTAITLSVGPAWAKDKPPSPPVAAPAANAAPVAALAPPRKASATDRAEAERLDPLARAAFWAREVEVDGRDAQAGVRLAAALRTLGRNEEAAGAAGRVLVIDPDDKDALLEWA